MLEAHAAGSRALTGDGAGPPIGHRAPTEVEKLSAQPGAPATAPRADEIEKPVGAFHSAEGLPDGQEQTPEGEVEHRGELIADDDPGAAENHPLRRKDFDAFQKARVCGLIGAGMSQRQASAYLGFHPSVVSKALQRDQKFAADVAQAMAAATFNPLYKVIKASERNWRAAVWLLKHAQPHTDLTDREARRAARKAEKEALRKEELEREARARQQKESDDAFFALSERVRREMKR